MYGSHWLEEKLLQKDGFDNSTTKFAIQVLKVNETVRHLQCKLSQLIGMGKRSLLNLPAPENIANYFAKEWGFHIRGKQFLM